MKVSGFKQSSGRSQHFVHLFQGAFTDVLTHLCNKGGHGSHLTDEKMGATKSKRHFKSRSIKIEKSEVIQRVLAQLSGGSTPLGLFSTWWLREEAAAEEVEICEARVC